MARHRLYVDVACTKCGTVRQLPKHNVHPELCRRCSYDSRVLGSVKLTCVGYKIYGVTDHASNCPREVEKKRKTLKDYGRSKGIPQTTDDGEHAFIDADRGQYRCKWCAGALFLLRKLERDVKQFCKKLGESIPKIQSVNDLIRERKRLSNLSVEHEDEKTGTVTVELFDPHSFAHNPENKRKWGPRANSVEQQTALLIKRSKNANVVKGLCQFCNKIVFSTKDGKASTVKVHARCYQDSSQGYRNGVSRAIRKRGGQVELEILRRNYSWALRHKLRGKPEDSYGALAKEYDVTKRAVVKGIDFVLAHLPGPELVGKHFRDRITRLKSPASIQVYASSQEF
jgi:hypothetical protein